MLELQHKKKKIKKNVDHPDGIKSNVLFPDDVIEKIFFLLPVCSVFEIGWPSKRFHNSWKFNENFHFDKDFFQKHRKQEDFVQIVNQILKLHSGPKIHSFKLFFEDSNETIYSNVEKWIQIAVTKGVEEIHLDFCTRKMGDKFIFECGSVKVLNLKRCSYKIPQYFKSFHSLTSLVLRQVRFVAETWISAVLSNCASLEILELVECTYGMYGYRPLDISAQNLKNFNALKVVNSSSRSHLHSMTVNSPTMHSLVYHGRRLKNIIFIGELSNLNDAVLNFTETERLEAMKTPLLHFSRISILTISSVFLEVRGRTEVCLPNLRELQLVIEPTAYCNPCDIALFMEYCQNLENVFIDIQGTSLNPSLFYELLHKKEFEEFDSTFQHLKYVKMKGFKHENKYHVQLGKLFLQKAGSLETLVLVTPRNRPKKTKLPQNHLGELLDGMLGSFRLSPTAEVVALSYGEDSSYRRPTHNMT